jgi:magnesium-transporting ATPase (P-type)
MIEIAAILSALVRDWADLGIILALLIVNALVGFWEEYQAGNAIAALKAQLALKAKVKRDNIWKTIPTRELVPGDLIRLRLGDIALALILVILILGVAMFRGDNALLSLQVSYDEEKALKHGGGIWWRHVQ